MRPLLASAAMTLAALGMGACGGDQGASDELVRIHTRQTLDFRMDPDDGPEHVFPVDWTWVVDRDGTATEIGVKPGPDRSQSAELSADELRRIKRQLARLDFKALQRRFGTEKTGDGTTVLTYHDQTLTLDSRIMGFSSPEEAPPLARPLSRVSMMLARRLETPAGGSSG